MHTRMYARILNKKQSENRFQGMLNIEHFLNIIDTVTSTCFTNLNKISSQIHGRMCVRNEKKGKNIFVGKKKENCSFV